MFLDLRSLVIDALQTLSELAWYWRRHDIGRNVSSAMLTFVNWTKKIHCVNDTDALHDDTHEVFGGISALFLLFSLSSFWICLGLGMEIVEGKITRCKCPPRWERNISVVNQRVATYERVCLGILIAWTINTT